MAKQKKDNINSLNLEVGKAQRDPASFASQFTEEERAMLKQIADQIKGGKNGFDKH